MHRIAGMKPLARLRRCVVAVVVTLGALVAVPAHAQEGKFPDRPLTIVVPFAAGGGADLGARLLAADLEKELGQPVVVVNREGAGSQTGLTFVAQSKPDGYTIGGFNMPAANTILLSPERKAAFGIDSFDYIMNHVLEPLVIGVRPDSPWKMLKELMEDARKRPNELRVGTSGALTPEHLAQLQFEQAAPTRLRIAHFGGAAGSMTEFRAGRTDVLFTTPAFAGEIRPLAVLTKERVAVLPDVPTASEQGYPQLVMTSSRGFVVPKGVPPPVLARLREAFAKVANSEPHRARMAERKLNLQVIAGEEYDRYVRQTHQESGRLVQLAKERQ